MEEAAAVVSDMPFQYTYAALPERFYERIAPVPVREPKLLLLNQSLAVELGLEENLLEQSEFAELLAGNRTLPEMQPIAMAYAGHQFGHFVPQLGDGRAILLGELEDASGTLRDIHLKGSGITKFSRRGDGRAPLGAVVREYIVSEALHALGIPTTRTLAILASGEFVIRHSLVPGGVLVRVAASHIRVGTFEYFAAQGDTEAIQLLVDYAIERHYPELAGEEAPAFALLRTVADRQARLIANWMQVGFIHGVMNTDNMAISGESIDFGPCAFMDEYNSKKVFSSIDELGRYAFSNQPLVAKWNLARLAEALLPVINPGFEKAFEMAVKVIEDFLPCFKRYYRTGMLAKIGIQDGKDEDAALIEDLLELMEGHGADFTVTFRNLSELLSGDEESVAGEIFATQEFKQWQERWIERLLQSEVELTEIARQMCRKNPLYIARNHQVERVIAAADEGELEPLIEFLEVLKNPYETQEGAQEYSRPPEEHERVRQTFCGT